MKQKKIILRLSNELHISFVLFPQASEPSVNFNTSKMVHWLGPFNVRIQSRGKTLHNARYLRKLNETYNKIRWR